MNHEISLDGLSVSIGIPAGRDLPALTVRSIVSTYSLLHRHRIPVNLLMIANCAVVQWARDEIVDLFLKNDSNRLFWIDSDMVWEAEDFMRLLALSQVYDVVGATYPAKEDQPTFYLHRTPEMTLDRNEHGLIELSGLGLGFTVMRKEVIQKLCETKEKVWDEISKRELHQVFRVGSVVENGRNCRIGEDMAFFNDIRGLGYKVWMDPEVNLGHIGMKKYTGSIMSALVDDSSTKGDSNATTQD